MSQSDGVQLYGVDPLGLISCRELPIHLVLIGVGLPPQVVAADDGAGQHAEQYCCRQTHPHPHSVGGTCKRGVVEARVVSVMWNLIDA